MRNFVVRTMVLGRLVPTRLVASHATTPLATVVGSRELLLGQQSCTAPMGGQSALCTPRTRVGTRSPAGFSKAWFMISEDVGAVGLGGTKWLPGLMVSFPPLEQTSRFPLGRMGD